MGDTVVAKWRLSTLAVGVVKRGIAQYLENPGRPDFDYCPVIGWSLGGELTLADGRRSPTPARYELGITAVSDIAEYGLVRIDDPTLGIVAFQPSQEDVASNRRLVDYDGQDIVVR